MASLTLDEAWTKLRRAEHHLNVLRADVERFAQANEHRIALDKNLHHARYNFMIVDLQPTPPAWPVVIGDCVHNARTALDYLMVRLVAIVTGKAPEDIEDVQFPIYEHRSQLNSSLGELKKELALSGYLARIDELQIYNNGNPSIWGQRGTVEHRIVVANEKAINIKLVGATPAISPLPIGLDRLSKLDNIDKHRALHSPWHRLLACIGDEDTAPTLTPPDGYKVLNEDRVFDALEDYTHVGTLIFDGPITDEWTPTDVEMKAYFPIEVAIGEPQAYPESMLQVLQLCLWSARKVLDIFAPVFGDWHMPPLPVTIALD